MTRHEEDLALLKRILEWRDEHEDDGRVSGVALDAFEAMHGRLADFGGALQREAARLGEGHRREDFRRADVRECVERRQGPEGKRRAIAAGTSKPADEAAGEEEPLMFGLAEVAVATVVGGAWVVSASLRFARFVLVQEGAQEKERLAQEEKGRQAETQEDAETIAVRAGFAEKRRILERSRETYANRLRSGM